jgi:oligopeptide transport system substrate-binding protein
MVVGGCTPDNRIDSTPVPVSEEATAIPATPAPTQLPGSMVLPLTSMGNSIPWLPMDNTKRPTTYYFYFNIQKPPFDNVLVRQAFTAAIDRDVIRDIAEKFNRIEPKSATTFTPAATLGRDLNGSVGIAFDPVRAKALLVEAGYTEMNVFPTVSVIVPVSTADAPGFHVQTSEALINMWETNLGVKVTIDVIEWGTYLSRIASSPPDIFSMTWVADYNDPDNFLREIFTTSSEYNYGHFSNEEFDRLVNQAKTEADPAKRQLMYIQAERILCETEAALIPMYHLSTYLP